MLTVGVLGLLAMSIDGRPVVLTSGKLRTLLVVLAMAARSPVPVELWYDERHTMSGGWCRRTSGGCGAALSSPAAALFRLLGLHCGPDISAPAAASPAGLPVSELRPLLAELTRRAPAHRAHRRPVRVPRPAAGVRRRARHRARPHEGTASRAASLAGPCKPPRSCWRWPRTGWNTPTATANLRPETR